MRSLGDPADLEEERRLAYVGITRAQRRLYLTLATTRNLWGMPNYNSPSRFLGEIPKELLTDAPERRRRPALEAAQPRATLTGDQLSPGDRVRHRTWGPAGWCPSPGRGTGPRWWWSSTSTGASGCCWPGPPWRGCREGASFRLNGPAWTSAPSVASRSCGTPSPQPPPLGRGKKGATSP